MRRTIADLLLRGGSAAGVLIGFLLGFQHQPHVRCGSRNHGGAAINQCPSHVLSHLVLHWGLFLGGGLLVGGALGLLAGLAIYPRRMRTAG